MWDRIRRCWWQKLFLLAEASCVWCLAEALRFGEHEADNVQPCRRIVSHVITGVTGYHLLQHAVICRGGLRREIMCECELLYI